MYVDILKKIYSLPLFLGIFFALVVPEQVLAQSSVKVDSNEIEKIKLPPRDIKDILRVLEQAKPDQDVLEKSKAIIAMAVPQSDDRDELNNFYQRRAKAYQNIGKINLAIDDARRAAVNFQSSNPRFWTDPQKLDVMSNFGGLVLWRNTVLSSNYESFEIT